MGGRFEKTPSSSSSKRRRRNYDCAESSRKRRRRNYDCAESSRKRRRRNYDCAESSSTRRKQHLYLALDDWEGGYHIYKLDADEIYSGGLHELPEPAIRINSSVHGPMDFAALGTSIFVALNLRYYFDDDDAPPTIVYNTKTAALGVGPPLPSGIPAFWAAMAAREKLYALTTEVLSLQALSWAPANNTWNLRDDEMDWLWNSESSLPPCSGLDVVAYALHPDGRTIFMSTASATHSFDTSNGLWKELGDWVLPFRGQAYFDASLDAWVGIHHKGEGYVCCCPVASRSTAAKRPPDCRMLKEKLFRHNNEEPWISGGRHMDATLTYTGYNRFCLVENILRHENAIDSMLHVTLFSLKYDSVGELRTKVQPCTRSYAVSKNTMLFSHAAFWM